MCQSCDIAPWIRIKRIGSIYWIEQTQTGVSQYRPARFVARNYDWSKTGKAIVQQRGWKHSSKEGRNSSKLMFKLESGKSELKMSKYIEHKTVRITRHCLHNKWYIPSQYNANKYLQSYILGKIREWNALPSQLVNSNSLDSIDAVLAGHLSDWVLCSSTWLDGTTVPLPS